MMTLITLIICLATSFYIYKIISDRLSSLEDKNNKLQIGFDTVIETRKSEITTSNGGNHLENKRRVLDFWINVSEALILHKNFKVISGIESIGKPSKDWTTNDSIAYQDKYSKKMMIRFTYLESENRYYICSEGVAFFTRINEDLPIGSNLLYQNVIVGDENKLREHIELNIFERKIKNHSMKKASNLPVISICLSHKKGIGEKADFKVLMDFPLTYSDAIDDTTNEALKNKLEKIEINTSILDEDVFGDALLDQTSYHLKKNGIEVFFSQQS